MRAGRKLTAYLLMEILLPGSLGILETVPVHAEWEGGWLGMQELNWLISGVVLYKIPKTYGASKHENEIKVGHIQNGVAGFCFSAL